MPARILNYTTALRKLFGEVLPKPLAWYNATIETQKLSVTAKNSHVSPRSHMTWPMCRMRREIASCQVCPHFVSLGGLLPFISACGFPCALFSKPSSEIEEGRLWQRSVCVTDSFIKSVPVLFGWLFSCHMRPGKKKCHSFNPFFVQMTAVSLQQYDLPDLERYVRRVTVCMQTSQYPKQVSAAVGRYLWYTKPEDASDLWSNFYDIRIIDEWWAIPHASILSHFNVRYLVLYLMSPTIIT